MTQPERVVVVGGGLAGLAAAVRLADAGLAVDLVESRPRLGGATHSFDRDGLVVDNGQHVFLRCCTAYRGFLDRLGVSGLTTLQRRLDVPVLTAGHRPARLRRAGLPAPLHLAVGLARYRPLSVAERARVGPAALALRRLDPADPALDGQAFGRWLADHGQSPAAVAGLWDLVTTATLNAPASHASLALAAMVFRTGLLGHAAAGDLGLPAVPLSRLHGEPAAAALRAAGARVRLRGRVRSVLTAPDGVVSGVALDDGVLAADAVVLAVPHDAAAGLLPAGALPAPVRLLGLGTSPIVNVHVHYDRRVLPAAFAAALDSPAQWIFDRTAAAGAEIGQYLTVSVSAADDWVDRPTAALRAVFLPALARLLPAARQARVITSFVTRERTATFRPVPGTAALRPGPVTATPGLFLAGSWTDTGWPATMESAVRSGVRAAECVVASIGRRRAGTEVAA